MHNIEYLIWERYYRNLSLFNPIRIFIKQQAKLLKKYELNVINKFDNVFTINENENTSDQQTFQQSLPPMNNPLYTGNTTSINQLPVVNVQRNNYQEDTQNQGQAPEPMAANEGGSAFGSIFG